VKLVQYAKRHQTACPPLAINTLHLESSIRDLSSEAVSRTLKILLYPGELNLSHIMGRITGLDQTHATGNHLTQQPPTSRTMRPMVQVVGIAEISFQRWRSWSTVGLLLAAGAAGMRHGALAWTAHAPHRRQRPLLFLVVRPQQPLSLQWSATRISSTSRQPLEDDNDAENTENSSNLNDTLWDDDLDGIGSLFGGASSVPPPPTTMKSSMLHFVTQYLKKSNASDVTEKTTETAWTIPEFTIVSSPELDIDDDDKVGTNNDWKNISSPTETSRSLQGLTSRRVYSDLLAKKAKSAFEPNPIFERYKNSTLVAANSNNSTDSFNGATTSAATVFPSAEHCIGFWRWLQSPTGFAVEASDAGSSSSRSSSTVSDNLILRVDGTIAGGPILDAEFRHKPSGGQWDLSSSNNNDGDQTVSLLRISLYIPPAKQRMLVLQGILQQEAPPPVALSSLSSSGTMSCRGTVWVQDIVPLASLDANQHRRDPVGTFAMVKLPSATNRESYTITIPRNVRPLD
jgi:hypothetical protein